MANRVRAHVVSEDMAAACKLGASHWKMLLSPVREVVKPTTPAIRDNITKKPVVMFPIGKYIGNIRAGRDKTDATYHTNNADSARFIYNFKLTNSTYSLTCFTRPLNPMIHCPRSNHKHNEVQHKIQRQEDRGYWFGSWSHETLQFQTPTSQTENLNFSLFSELGRKLAYLYLYKRTLINSLTIVLLEYFWGKVVQ